jgi:cytochrome b6-f complex iron-sulfur subunit
MKRRDFIQRLAAGALCGALAASTGGCAHSLPYVRSTRKDRLLIVQRSDFGEGPHALLENPQSSRAIYLRRFPDDTFAAVSTRCTHRGCAVAPAGNRLACPCHGSEYTFEGEVLNGPAERPLFRYEVTADADAIYIELPASAKP